jgi:phospholipase/carboxylesterase
VLGLLLLTLAGCGEEAAGLVDTTVGSARLSARHAAPTEPSSLRGKLPLDSAYPERGLLYVPESYQAGTPAALVVLLHGASGTGEDILPLLQAHADANGTLVLAPTSLDGTWDLLSRSVFGPDRAFIDEALARVFREYSVHPRLLGVSGFSDGASYALSLGLTNGDLFQSIVAFSPGGSAASELVGRPDVFISHGTQDPVLPIDLGGRYLSKKLREEEYTVVYREFEGRHTVPEDIARDGFIFIAGTLLP